MPVARGDYAKRFNKFCVEMFYLGIQVKAGTAPWLVTFFLTQQNL